ncbi:unnamed protein product [marine sediment metagenome]|uniref:GatB/YqeY domain-containing protein n=1 Tax=marine sediment metagenome TaxID=412755 RepID=X1NKB6_9ZZZZ
MNLKNKIQQDITQSLKQGEKGKLEALRYLNAQIQNKELEKGRKKLTDEEVIKLINGQLKKLEEGLSFFEKGERKELAQKTKNEITILKTYLPKQLSDEELEKEIEKIIKENLNLPHPGALIGIAVKKLAGKADNKRVSELVMKKVGK